MTSSMHLSKKVIKEEAMAGTYVKLELLGSGTFGKAWLVKSKQYSRKYVVKEIQVCGMSEKDKEQALTEVSTLAKFKHWNIIRYKEAFVDRGMLHIAMEFADAGDLWKKILGQHGILFKERVILDWFAQICFALKYIHGKNILHRDLKTRNIFLTKDNVIKVGDFGSARILQDTDDHAKTAIGTPYYLSPEICKMLPYNHKSDMWSSGCVLYELCTLQPPFDAPDFNGLVFKILQGQYQPISDMYGPLLEDLVSVLLKVEADQRPSAEQVLCIPAMQHYVDSYIQKALGRKDKVHTSSPAVGQKGPKRQGSLKEAEKENMDPIPTPKSAASKKKLMQVFTPQPEMVKPSPKIVKSAETVAEKEKLTFKQQIVPRMSLLQEVMAANGKKRRHSPGSRPRLADRSNILRNSPIYSSSPKNSSRDSQMKRSSRSDSPVIKSDTYSIHGRKVTSVSCHVDKAANKEKDINAILMECADDSPKGKLYRRDYGREDDIEHVLFEDDGDSYSIPRKIKRKGHNSSSQADTSMKIIVESVDGTTHIDQLIVSPPDGPKSSSSPKSPFETPIKSCPVNITPIAKRGSRSISPLIHNGPRKHRGSGMEPIYKSTPSKEEMGIFQHLSPSGDRNGEIDIFRHLSPCSDTKRKIDVNRILYNSCTSSNKNVFSSMETLSTHLEQQLGPKDFLQCYDIIKSSKTSGELYETFAIKMREIHHALRLLPLFVQLFQLETISKS